MLEIHTRVKESYFIYIGGLWSEQVETVDCFVYLLIPWINDVIYRYTRQISVRVKKNICLPIYDLSLFK